jgi:uncharacterized protein (UPF0332 family)
LDKSARALGSAQLLLEAGDSDGACNRAYFAMFDAARAALHAVSAPADPLAIRTHSGLIAAFGLFIVKAGRLPVEHGRALNRVHELRLIADYQNNKLNPELVGRALSDCAGFVAAVRQMLDHERLL